MEVRRRSCLSALVFSLVLTAGLLPGAALARSSAQATQCIYDHTMLTSPAGTCRPHALTYPTAVTNKVERAIYDASLTFGVPYGLLLNVAQCESDLNPRASNGTHFGLFQFAPATFRRGSVQMRQMTGIVAKSYWHPKDASYVAGFLFAYGLATSWTCLRWSGN